MAKQAANEYKTLTLAFTMISGAITLLLWYLVESQGKDGLQGLLTAFVVATSVGGVLMGLAYGSATANKKK